MQKTPKKNIWLARILVYTVAFTFPAFFVYLELISVNPEAIKDFCAFLASISAMVFTIMGIWIAFLYPNALLKFTNPDKLENIDFSYGGVEAKRLSYIVSSVLMSAFVMTVLAAFFFARIFSISLDFSTSANLIMRSLFAGGITLLFAIQMQAVLAVILANIIFLNDLYERKKSFLIDND